MANYYSTRLCSCMISIDFRLLILENNFRKIKKYDHLLNELNNSSLNKSELNLNKFKDHSIDCNALSKSSDYNNICFVCRNNCSETTKEGNCRTCEHKKDQHALLQQKFKFKTLSVKAMPRDLEDGLDTQSHIAHSSIKEFLLNKKEACEQLIDEEKNNLSSSLKELEKTSEVEDFFKVIKQSLIEPRNELLERRRLALTQNDQTSFLNLTNEEIECSKKANRIVLDIIEILIQGLFCF